MDVRLRDVAKFAPAALQRTFACAKSWSAQAGYPWLVVLTS
jgi:hypothetical protein